MVPDDRFRAGSWRGARATAARRGPIATGLDAARLLTGLPLPSDRSFLAGTPSAGTGAAAFPLVGAVLGSLAAVVVLLLGPAEPALAAIAAVALGAVLTRALHLDGLADTADALVAPDPARAEQARRDPSTGAAAVVALILAVTAEIAALASLTAADPAFAAGAVIVAATVGRLLPVLAGAVLSDRGGSGFGAWFVRGVGPLEGIVAGACTAVVLIAVTGWLAAPALALAGVIGGLVGGVALTAVLRLRGGPDGDSLGASVVWTTMACLWAAALVV